MYIVVKLKERVNKFMKDQHDIMLVRAVYKTGIFISYYKFMEKVKNACESGGHQTSSSFALPNKKKGTKAVSTYNRAPVPKP